MKRAQILAGIAGLAAAAGASQAPAQRSLYPLPLPQQAAEAPPQAYGPAQPEGAPPTNFDRDRNVSVSERARPDYQAAGLQLGGFTAYPKLTVGVERDDNVGATATNTDEDTIYVVAPELVIERVTADSQIQAFIRGSRRMNQDFVKETTTDYQGGASGSYEVGGGIRLMGGGDYGRYTEPRTSTLSPGGTVKPVEYKLGQADLGLTYAMDRLRLTGRADYQDYDFHDGRTATDAEVDQDFRDRQIMTYTAKAEYALNPNTSVFLVSAFDDRKYDRQPPAVALNRSSKGKNIAIGANFDFSALARGEIQIGYVEQDYDAPAVRDIEGITGKALVEWFPTDLTTLTLTGSRDVRDATVPGAGGFLSGNFGLQIDQELLDNLILTARVGYGLDQYKGIDRKDERTSGSLGANYLLNRHVGFTVAYDYLKQVSSGAAVGPEFEDNKVSVSSSLQF
jgi:hypothetical protein